MGLLLGAVLASEVKPEPIEGARGGAWVADEQCQHAYGDATVGNVEDGTEEGVR